MKAKSFMGRDRGARGFSAGGPSQRVAAVTQDSGSAEAYVDWEAEDPSRSADRDMAGNE